MPKKVLLHLIVLIALISSGAAALCSTDDSGELATDCYRLFKTFESALIEGEGNLYRMGKAFFYSPNADPVLLKVVYNITYGKNMLLNSTSTLSYCSGDDSSSYVYFNITNDTINDTTLTYGWTSNGIFTAFHPSLLNWMQMQLPLGILRLLRLYTASTEIGPQAESFLWNGSPNLPALHINLHIESLPCLPSDQLYNVILQDITALGMIYTKDRVDTLRFFAIDSYYSRSIGASKLKAYAAAQEVISDFKNIQHIGYSLDSDSTSTRNLLSYGYDYIFFIYYIIGLVLCVFSTIVIMPNFQKTIKDKLSEITIHQLKLWKTLCYVAVGTILSELFFEFVWSIIWSTNADSSSNGFIWLTYILTKFMPSLLLFILSLVFHKKFGFIGLLFVVLILSALMVYWFALPTFLFLLVYPINVVAVFAYMAAFMFTLIVCITITSSGLDKDEMRKRIKCVVTVNIIFVLMYLLFVLVIVLYIVAIGKTSVITLSLYGVLSLLPSVAITAVSWIFKNKVFKEGEWDNEPGTDPELDPILNPPHNTSGTDVRQRTQYQTVGEQST